MSTGTRGGVSEVCDEEMEEYVEMEEDSTSNVTMLATIGTFIVGTTDGTVAETSHEREVPTYCCERVCGLIESTHSGLWVGLSRTRQKCCVVFLQEIRLQTDQGSRCPTKSLSHKILTPPVSLLYLHLHQLQAFLWTYTITSRPRRRAYKVRFFCFP